MKKHIEPYIGVAIDNLQIVSERAATGEADFLADRTLQDATLMRLQVAGEQLAKIRELFPDFYDEHSTESWHKLIGLRNIISHSYSQIDMTIVWDIVYRHAPELLNQLMGLADGMDIKQHR